MNDTDTGIHWLTRYDPDDGEPYGETCSCSIGADHDASGELNGIETWPLLTAEDGTS